MRNGALKNLFENHFGGRLSEMVCADDETATFPFFLSSMDLVSDENKFIVMIPSIFFGINTWL
jgi:hypothetical protein